MPVTQNPVTKIKMKTPAGQLAAAGAPLARTSPPSPFGFRRDSLRSFRYGGLRVACRAVAREASEGWWRMQSSEAGLQGRNREFSKNFGPKQVSDASAVAGQSNFDRDPKQLHTQ
jgi:hypothetical protein